MHRLVAVLLAATVVQAQLAPTTEKIDVAVTEIDVVVVDQSGKPVTGLKQKDFELRVNGRPRTISNFYEVNREPDRPSTTSPSGEPQAVERRDFLLIFIDEAHLHSGGKRRVLDGLRAFVQREVRPGTAAMLVDFNDSIEIRQRFTEDPLLILQAIDRVSSAPARASEYESARREFFDWLDRLRYDEKLRDHMSDQLPTMLDRVADAAQADAERTIAGVSTAAKTMAGLDGRRVLVFVSDGLPMQPGVEISDAFHPDEFAPKDSQMYTTVTQFKNLDTLKHNLQLPLQQLATETTAAGVQFFAIDARAGQSTDLLRDASATQTRLNENLIRTNLHGPVQLLADETGGQAILDENDMNAAFERLSGHLRSYYSLGFRSDGSKEDAGDVRVRVKRRGVTVRATRHLQQRSTREQIADRLRANLYAPVEDNPLNATLEADPVTDGLRLTFGVPLPTLSFVPGNAKAFAVGVAMLDQNNIETPARMVLVRVGSADSAESIHTLTLRAAPGNYIVSVAIADGFSSQVSFLQRQVIVP